MTDAILSALQGLTLGLAYGHLMRGGRGWGLYSERGGK